MKRTEMYRGYIPRRRVLKIDIDGKVVAIYPSARAAARENYTNYQSIINRCKGKVIKTRNLDGYDYAWESEVEEC